VLSRADGEADIAERDVAAAHHGHMTKLDE
jgi:hypothetical protein